MPVVFTHGWPGSVVEFLDVIEPLRDPRAPRRRSGRRVPRRVPDAARLRLQRQADGAGWNVERIADAWAELMIALGYERFGAQGGDWGSAVTTAIGLQHADRCLGIHLNMVTAGPGKDAGELTEARAGALARLDEHRRWGMGYSTQQSTRPQTLGYGLVDSPAAQAAWIIEKFWAWADHGGHPEDTFTRDRLLDNVMHYWLPGAGASSGRLYWESFSRFGARDTVDVPAGMSIFPKEIFSPSRRWAERRFTDIRHWNELDAGGHFAAFEQPASFVDEVRTFFRTGPLTRRQSSTAPSVSSRSTSAWPAWRAVSSIMWTMIQRRLTAPPLSATSSSSEWPAMISLERAISAR